MKELLLKKKEEFLKQVEQLRVQITMYEGALQYNELLLQECEKEAEAKVDQPAP